MSIRQQLEENGFVNLGTLSPQLNTVIVANQIGKIIRVSGTSEVQKLSPRDKNELPQNTYSGNFGLGNFPLHTDLAHWSEPPRYFLLRCIVPDPEVVTSVINFKTALQELKALTIARALFKPRRKLENRQFLLRFNRNQVFRWDRTFLIPENKEAIEVAECINNIKQQNVQSFRLLERGQVFLIDNWRVLHGRSKIGDKSSTRLIERVYLSEVNL